jgi:predicted  nucleic acid-binding Zn-ribbon protein
MKYNKSMAEILAEMNKVKEQETDPVQKAQDKLDKARRIADLKKQIDGIKDEEALDDKDVDTIKPIIKQLKKSVKAHDKQAKQLQKDIEDETDLKDKKKVSLKKLTLKFMQE